MAGASAWQDRLLRAGGVSACPSHRTPGDKEMDPSGPRPPTSAERFRPASLVVRRPRGLWTMRRAAQSSAPASRRVLSNSRRSRPGHSPTMPPSSAWPALVSYFWAINLAAGDTIVVSVEGPRGSPPATKPHSIGPRRSTCCSPGGSVRRKDGRQAPIQAGSRCGMAARSNSRRSGALRCNDAVQHSSGVKCDGRHMIHPSLPLSQCLTLDGEPVALSPAEHLPAP